MTQLDQTPLGSSTVRPDLSTYLPAILRTVVPLIYAMLIRWGVVEWLDPNDVFVTSFLTVLVTAVFYVLLRLLERYKTQLGWLLGYAVQPSYVPGVVLTTTTTATADAPTTVAATLTSSKATVVADDLPPAAPVDDVPPAGAIDQDPEHP